MNAKLRYRLLSALVALCMVLVLFPAVALAAEDPVAQIGDTTYATLDEAVAAAADGATIELLADATTSGLNLSKDLTIQAAEGLETKPTVTFTQYGIALWGKALTFKDCNVVMNGIGSTPYTAEWNWMTICASSDASLTLNNVTMTMDATGVSNSPQAIYFCNNNVLNLENGTELTIKNYANDALEWDGGNGGYNVNIIDSTFTSDHNRSGFTGTFYATITNSKVDVINSSGNGSNGSHFIITDSKVNFSDNGSHGLSAGELSIDNSTVTTENNHGMGIAVNNNLTIKNGSIVTVTGNADNSSYGYAAVRCYNDFAFSVDSTSALYINDNNNTGLYVRQGNLTVADGAILEITGNNVTHNKLDGYGGGIYVGYGDNYDPTVVLPANAKIYNNHAITGGDDIYVSEGVNGPSLTFGKVGDGWILDGDPDCEHRIDGWYDDSNGTRWEAHAETEEGNHIAEFTNFDEETGLATVTGLTALKAAHGAEGKDKTSYPGLDKVIVTEGEDGMLVDAKEDTAAAGDTVNFKLTTNVPDDLLNYINLPDVDDPSVVNVLADEPVRGSYQLVIHDQMDDELVLDPESFVVMIGDIELALMDEYTIAYDVSHNEDGTICDFEITLDLVSLYEMGAITEEDIDNATPITVTYTATLKEDATAGAYLNTAWVTYPEGESEKDTVKVKTYGIDIFKYDQALGVDGENAGLAGAGFALYGADDVTVAEEDGTVTVNPDADPILTVTSGEDGDVVINGLDKGVYYLMETKAPEGYVQSTTPLKVTIPDDADETTYLVEVNFANAQVPHTGGTGTLMYTIGGAAIILLAGALLLISRYSRKKQVG